MLARRLVRERQSSCLELPGERRTSVSKEDMNVSSSTKLYILDCIRPKMRAPSCMQAGLESRSRGIQRKRSSWLLPRVKDARKTSNQVPLLLFSYIYDAQIVFKAQYLKCPGALMFTTCRINTFC